MKAKEVDQSRSCKMTKAPQGGMMIDLTSDDKEFPHTGLRSRSTRRDVGVSSPTPIIVGRPAIPILTSSLKRTISDNGLEQLLNHRETHNEVSTHRTIPLRSGDLSSLNDSYLYDMLTCAETNEDYDYDEPAMDDRYRPLPPSNLGHLRNDLNSQSAVAQRVSQSMHEATFEQTPSRYPVFTNHGLEPMESWGGNTNRKRNQPTDAVARQDERNNGPKRRKEMNEEEDQANGIVMEQTAIRTKAEERRRKKDEERLRSRARRNAARLTSNNAFNEQRRDRQAGCQPAFGPDKALDLTLEMLSEGNLSTEEQNSSLRTAREILDYQGRHPDIKHESDTSRPGERKGGPSSTSSMLQAVTHSNDDFIAETRTPKPSDTLTVGALGESGGTDVGQVAEDYAIKGFIRSSKPIHLSSASEPFNPKHSKTAPKLHDGTAESPLPSAGAETCIMDMDDSLRPEDLFDGGVLSTPAATLKYPDCGTAIISQRSEVPSDKCRDRMASVTSDLAVVHLIKSMQDIDSQKQRTKMISFEDELKLIATNKKARQDAYSVQYRARHGTGTCGLHQRVSDSQRSAGDDHQPVAPFSKSSKLKKLSTMQVEPVRNNTLSHRENREPERQVDTPQSRSTLSHDSQVHSTLASSTSSKGFAAWAMSDDNPSGTVDGTEKTQRKRDYLTERLQREDKHRQEEQVQNLLGSSFSHVSSRISSSQPTDPKPSQRKRKPAHNACKDERRQEQRRLARGLRQGDGINNPNSTRTASFTLAANHDGEQVDLEHIDAFKSTINEDELKRIRSQKASSQRMGQEDQKLLAIKSALQRFNPDRRQNADVDSQQSAPVNENKADTQLPILYHYGSSSSSDEDEDDEQVEKRRELRHAERLATVPNPDTPTVNTPDDVTNNPFRQTKGGKGLSPAVLVTLESEEVKLKDPAVCHESGTSQASDDSEKIEQSVAQAHFQYFIERMEYFHDENKDEVKGATYGPYFLLEEANTVAREILTPAQRGLDIFPPWYFGVGKDASGMDRYDLEVKDGRIETSITKKPCPPRKLPRSVTNRFRPEKSYIAYQKTVPNEGSASIQTLGVFTVPDLANKEAGMAWLASATHDLIPSEINRIKRVEVESGMRRTLVELEEREGLFRDWVGEDEFWVEEHDTRGPRN